MTPAHLAPHAALCALLGITAALCLTHHHPHPERPACGRTAKEQHMTEDPEIRTAAITLLLGAAETTTEINALARVARRAGFLWRCTTCREDCYPTTEACRCGAPRPVDDAA
ncbi:hypothetical protein [Streptomyces sp. NPDC057429]|uniref:hypothetical protein n=1 Tax=Streptomyces sp. NPDC057429 TaxID=3346130 RepID=UPI0036B51B3C